MRAIDLMHPFLFYIGVHKMFDEELRLRVIFQALLDMEEDLDEDLEDDV